MEGLKVEIFLQNLVLFSIFSPFLVSSLTISSSKSPFVVIVIDLLFFRPICKCVIFCINCAICCCACMYKTNSFPSKLFDFFKISYNILLCLFNCISFCKFVNCQSQHQFAQEEKNETENFYIEGKSELKMCIFTCVCLCAIFQFGP